MSLPIRRENNRVTTGADVRWKNCQSMSATVTRDATAELKGREHPVGRRGRLRKDEHKSLNGEPSLKLSPKHIDDEPRGKGVGKWGALRDYIQQSGTWAYW